MKDDKLPRQNWDPCSPGVLQEAAQENPISRRRLVSMIGAGAVVGALGGGTALGIALSGKKNKSNEMMPGGIACIKVHDNLAAFISRKLKDSQLGEQISMHLMKCPSCKGAYNKMCCSSKSSSGSRPAKATLKPCARGL